MGVYIPFPGNVINRVFLFKYLNTKKKPLTNKKDPLEEVFVVRRIPL